MKRKETLIVLTDYSDFTDKFNNKDSNSHWGVLCTPVFLGGDYCLPLGWGKELDKLEIDFNVQIVEWYEEII